MAKSLLTPTLQQRICAALRAGAYMKDCATREGIAERTLYDWIARGEEATTTLGDEIRDPRHPEWPYVQFAQAVHEARAEARIEAVAMIRAHIVGRPAEYDEQGRTTRTEIRPDWRASLAYLERTDPEGWGRVWRGRPGTHGESAQPGVAVPAPEGIADDDDDSMDGVLVRLEQYAAAHEARQAVSEGGG